MTNFKSWNINEEDNEAWDALFPHSTDDVDDYLNSEGSDEDMLEIGSSVQIEVTTQGDETEGVGTLETFEDGGHPSFGCSLETPALEVLPATEVAMAQQVTTIEHVSPVTPQGKVAESEVNITISASAGNNCSVLNSVNVFLYPLLNLIILQNFLRKLLSSDVRA